MLIIFTLFGLIQFDGSLCQKSLLKMINSRQRSSEKCCQENNILSCQETAVLPNVLLKLEDIKLPELKPLKFINRVDPNGYFYANSNGDEAIITYNEIKGNMFGLVTSANNRSFALEKCF